MEEQNKSSQNNMAQINRALGYFIFFFGAVVLASIFFTETLVGKMTNFGAGAILVSVGACMILRSKKQTL